ncbi:MAG: 3',5'-cyclic-nucleotide phosphodiesterase [Bacteroidetes bacterium]|nr:3',5'-cyclic-nucleotide phosphodiesterase [Bacteroidota bacterium]
MKAIFTLALFSIYLAATSQSFTVVPLGVKGGLDESDLSAYMVAPQGSNDFICLDAGTLNSGIQKAIATGAFSPPASNILRNDIKGYLISHPHLDHVAGLIINSPDDSAKPIYGLQSCLGVIRDKYFSWQSWANFGDEGEKPQLNKYHYAPLVPGRETAIPGTTLSVQAWPLSHGAPYESTAFMVRSGDSYLLYLGDTGADSLEHSDRLHTLWLVAGPLLRAGKLKGIFIETSFPNEQPDRLLFGHLTPRLLMQEMRALANIAETPSLDRLNLVITHRKPSGDNEATIRRQLETDNPLRARLIFPEQGKRLDL